MKTGKRISACCLGLFLAGSAALHAGVYDGWNYRMKIRFAAPIPGSVTNFPVLAALSTNGIPGFKYSDFAAPANGADLRFSSSNETVGLNYEIESWNTNGQSLVWVQVPRIASTSDCIYAFWGRDSVSPPPCTTNGSTWTNGFGGVWHLDEQMTAGTSGATNRDSTPNRYHGSQSGNGTVPGRIGNAQAFDGNDEINCGDVLDPDSFPLTVSIWFKPGSTSAGCLYNKEDLYEGACQSGYHRYAWQPHWAWDGDSTFPIVADTWYQAVLVYDKAKQSMYANGRLVYSRDQAGDLGNNSQALRFGNRAYGDYYSGALDEIQISLAARASNWVYAAWLNQASNSTFLAFTDAGPVATGLTVMATSAGGVGARSATISGTVVHTGEAENPKLYFCWGAADGLTNSTSAWAHVVFVGTNCGKGDSFAANVSGLMPGSTYFYRCYATNSTGKAWSATAQSFVTDVIVYEKWRYRMTIRFQAPIPGTLAEFPAVVHLRTAISGFKYSDFCSPVNGADLRFADSSGTIALDHEIERWDTNGTSLAWVRVPSIAGTNDYIYAYWGYATNAAPCTTNGATWGSAYSGVWHMQNTNTVDSTTNNNDGVAHGGVTATTGMVGPADHFDGTGYVSVPATDLFHGSDNVTVELWVKPTGGGQSASTDLVDYDHATSPYKNWVIQRYSDPLNFGWAINDLSDGWGPWNAGATFAVTDDQWSHVALAKTGATYTYYVNGSATFSGAYSAALDKEARQLRFAGNVADGQRMLRGSLDEIRISSTGRASNWVYACWLNQASNSVFLGYSDAGAVPTGLTVRADAVTGRGPTSATLNGTVLYARGTKNPWIYFCWDYIDKGTNSTSAWTHTDLVGTDWGEGQSFAKNLTGLLTGSSYVYRCYATNSTGTNWSRTAQTFTTVSKPCVTNRGVSHVIRLSASLAGQVTDTGGQTPSARFYYWANGSGTTNTVSAGMQSGTFTSRVTGLTPGTLYHWSILVSNAAGTGWSRTNDFRTRATGAHDWYVCSTGDNTYATNWSTAFTSVQEVLGSTASNDMVCLRGERFALAGQLLWSNSYVTVRGGYEGAGLPGNRNPAVWPTVLTRTADTTHRILYVSGVTGCRLEGVTVTNGYAFVGSTPTHPGASGGGIFIKNAPGFVVDSCRILRNRIYHAIPNGGEIFGAGVYSEGSVVTFTNCIVASNRAEVVDTYNVQSASGGGIYVASGTTYLRNCMIFDNLADGDYQCGAPKGGGVGLNGTAEIRNCIIRNNNSVASWWSPQGMGDGVHVGSGNVLIRNCLIAGNHGSDIGVGIRQENGTLLIDNCTIATNKDYGVWRQDGTMVISNSVLWANGDDVYESSPSLTLSYCDIEDGDKAGNDGCISANPRFVDMVYFHEESPYGQYVGGYFTGGSWATGTTISAVIDGGAPASACSEERDPNGARVNMGLYGNTSAASKSHPLCVTNRAATLVNPTFGTLNGTLLYVGSSNVTVWFYYGDNNGMNVPGNWDTNVLAGTLTTAGDFAKTASNLAQGVTCYYTCFASNSAGTTAWASPSTNFTPSIVAPIVVNRGVSNEAGPIATLNGEVISTGGEAPQVYICWGKDDGGTTTGSWEHVEELGVKPDLFSTTAPVQAGSNYFYTCFAKNAAGPAWASPALPYGTRRIRYVAVNATGTGTGYSWSNAFTTIQAALDDCLSTKTNLICVKGGTYTLSIPVTWSRNHVTVRGGYEGTGNPGNRDSAQWPTAVSNVAAITQLLSLNGVSDGRIEHLTFTSANAPGNGGAISVVNATNITVANCLLMNNKAARYGGALAVSGSTNVVITGCTLSGNSVLNNVAEARGGAFYGENSYGSITNCVVERNRTSSTSGSYWYGGAGLYLVGGSWLLRDSHVRYNYTRHYYTGGGGLLVASGTHQLRNCTVVGNDVESWYSSGWTGDGICLNGGTLTLNNCTLAANGGEGWRVNAGTASARNSIFWENNDDLNRQGGSLTLVNCDIQDGDAGSGCISADPLFERGLYLAAGSLCVDAGADNAADVQLLSYTTRADGTTDGGIVNLGYHAFTGMPAARADLYVSTNGNNNSAGTNLASAVRTITRALAMAQEGSRVHVAAGSYSNDVETFPLPITRVGLQLLGTNSETTIIRAPGNPIQARVLQVEGALLCLVSGLTVSGGYLAGTVDGAGAYINNSPQLTIGSCIFTNNYLYCGGDQNTRGSGLFSVGNTSVTLTNCLVTRNTGYGTGGHNTGYNRGAGLFVLNGRWTILNCVFRGNYIYCNNLYDGSGAGLYLEAGPHIVRNCVIATNNCEAGPYCYPENGWNGGVWGDGICINAAGGVRIENCTVANNGGEGLRVTGYSVAMTNTILWQNGMDVTNKATLTMGYCDIGTGYANGVNCTSTDPLFADPVYYHEKSRGRYYTGGYFSGGSWAISPQTSPCVDAGDPGSSYSLEPYPNGSRVNMGAYGNTAVASRTPILATILLIR